MYDHWGKTKFLEMLKPKTRDIVSHDHLGDRKASKSRCCKSLMIAFVVASRNGNIHTNLKKAFTHTSSMAFTVLL